MTLLERIESPTESQSVDQRLLDTMQEVPGAFGLAVGHGPVGTDAFLVIDQQRTDFLDAELAAMERLLAVRREFPMEPIVLTCLSTADAAAFDPPSRMHVYRFA